MNRTVIKSPSQITLMRKSGALLATVFMRLNDFVKPGISTMEINDFVHELISVELDAIPASLGQYGYEYVLNCSINEVVCHGVPDKKRILKGTDSINIDITLEKNGFVADSSKMYLMPNAPQRAHNLSRVTYEALWKGIEVVKPGAFIGDIGAAISSYVKKYGYTVVKEYSGHGIGEDMHEEPDVLHFGERGSGVMLKEGMTFTIEPMINQGTANIKTLKDGWTVVTRDKKLSAQWEHTIAVTETGYEVLTLREEETPSEK